MIHTLLLSGAVFAYSMATYIIYRSTVKGHSSEPSTDKISMVFAVIALFLHANYVFSLSQQSTSLNFSLSSMTAMVSLILVSIFLLGCLGLAIHKLGLLVFPLTATSLVFSFFWGPDISILSHQPLLPLSAFSMHVLVSILAYCFLTIAAIQSLLFLYQERQIKQRAAPNVLSAFPPLETMELLLFRLIWIGFILLSFALLSGSIFSSQIFGRPFEFNHHTILAIIGWLVFAVILVKRIFSGMRASQAVNWTLIGFLLIQLGYFGTKLINESLQ